MAENLAEIYLSASLAFMAFLPAALSILISFYHTQRNNGVQPRELNSFRTAIHLITTSVPLILFSYFAALEGIIHFTRFSGFDSVFISIPELISVVLMSAAVSVVTLAILVFERQFFLRVDDQYTPIQDLLP
jgi:hypothetical protein